MQDNGFRESMTALFMPLLVFVILRYGETYFEIDWEPLMPWLLGYAIGYAVREMEAHRATKE
jgi:hypothetical protein